MLAPLAGSQPKPPAPDLGLAVEDFLVRHFPHKTVANIERPQALHEIDGAIDLNGRGQRGGPASVGVHLGIKTVDRRMVECAVIPA